MVTQKMISLKVDNELLVRLDNLVGMCDGRLSFHGRPVRVNRNKLINFALVFACSSLELQIDVLSSRHHDDLMPNFIQNI